MDSSSSGQQSNSISSSTQSSVSLRSKSDPAWAHFKENVVDGKKSWTCLFCQNTWKGGGINRMKKHLAGRKGDIAACRKVTHNVRYQMEESLKELDEKSQNAKSVGDDLYDVVDVEEELDTLQLNTQAQRKTTSTGKRKREPKIGSYFAPRTTPGAQPSIKSVLVSKEVLHNVDMAVARFVYNEYIPLNVVNSSYFQQMVDDIASVGPGYKLPKYNQLRINLMGDAKKEVQLLVDSNRAIWEEWGCTIMADGWQDRSNRQLINFMVYCKRGTIFVKSVDASNIVKDASTLCNLFVELIDWVGAKNIVHFVTDNGANYKVAGVLLNDKYPSIKWSPCAAHCLNLLLGDIGKMELVNGLAQRASLVTKFVYNHAFLLAWLRKREGWTEIVRPGPTRFATTFIALKSMLEHQHDLQAFFTSRTFRESRYYKDKKASAVLAVVLDSKFWSDCAIVVGVVAPLIRVLRIMDTDRRPSIGYVYDGILGQRRQ